MKKIKSVFTVATIVAITVLLLPVKALAAEFTDVPSNHWAYPTIKIMAESGIIDGFSDGRFRPANPVTREGWAKIVSNIAKLPTDRNAKSSFDDVEDSRWSKEFIEAAKYYMTSIQIGNKNLFYPGEGVSRADAAVSIIRLLGFENESADYSILKDMYDDYTTILALGPNIVPSISIAVKNGFMVGSDEKFRPNDILSRAEAATLLYRIGQKMTEMEKDTLSAIKVSPQKYELIEGQTLSLTVSPIPKTVVLPKLIWNSSNKNVAIVNQSGEVTAISEGTAEISARVENNGDIEAKCELTVKKLDGEAISLDKTELDLKVGAEKTLKVSILPKDAVIPTLKWSSANTKIAFVDSTGKITAVSEGTTTITVQTADGKLSAQCVVKIIPNLEDTISLLVNDVERISVTVGDTIALSWNMPLRLSVNEFIVYEVASDGKLSPVSGSLSSDSVSYKFIVKNAGTHTYKVFAYDSYGVSELESNVVTVEAKEKIVENNLPPISGSVDANTPIQNNNYSENKPLPELNIRIEPLFTTNQYIEWEFDPIDYASSYSYELIETNSRNLYGKGEAFASPGTNRFFVGNTLVEDYDLRITAYLYDGVTTVTGTVTFKVVAEDKEI